MPDETAPRGIGGVLATVHEITEKVDRRAPGRDALRDLGARAGEAKTAEEACAIAAATLAAHGKDVPFALLYLIDAEGKQARLAGAARRRATADQPGAAFGSDERIEPPGRSREAHRAANAMQVVEDLAARFDERAAAVRGRTRRTRPSCCRSRRTRRTSSRVSWSPASARG